MKWPEDIRPLIEKYSRGYGWISLYQDKPEEIENFKKVNQRMTELETQLREKGVTTEQLGEVAEKIKKILKKSSSEMSNGELLFVCQIIFGKDIKLITKDPRGDKIVSAVAKMKPEGTFFSSTEISKVVKIPALEVRNILVNLLEWKEILQLRPMCDAWAVSWKKRNELL